MFRARTVGSGSAVGQDVSRRHRRHAAGPAGSRRARGLLARVVRLVVSIIVLIIVTGIVLVVLKATPGNSIVSQIHDWARSLAGPFDGIFSFHNARVAIAVNWGIAAVVYVILGGLIVRLIGRAHR